MLEESLKIGLQYAAQKLEEIDNASAVGFKRGKFSAEFYVSKDVDLQQTHEQDEVYIVASDSGTFLRGKKQVSFVQGDFLFVPAGVAHRFEQFTKDFSIWVIFFGPKDGSGSTP